MWECVDIKTSKFCLIHASNSQSNQFDKPEDVAEILYNLTQKNSSVYSVNIYKACMYVYPVQHYSCTIQTVQAFCFFFPSTNLVLEALKVQSGSA